MKPPCETSCVVADVLPPCGKIWQCPKCTARELDRERDERERASEACEECGQVATAHATRGGGERGAIALCDDCANGWVDDVPWKPDPERVAACSRCGGTGRTSDEGIDIGACSWCSKSPDELAASAEETRRYLAALEAAGPACADGMPLAASAGGASLGREASNVGSQSGSRIIVGDFGAPKGPGCGSTPPGEDGGTRVGRPTGAAGARGAPGGGAAPAAESLRRLLAGVRTRLAEARGELRWLLDQRHDGKVYDFDPSCRNPDCVYGCGERKALLRANTRSEIAKLDHLLRRERTLAVRLTALSIGEAVDAAR